MGAIRDLIEGFDQSDKLEAEAAAHLDTLSALAEAKAVVFKETINDKLNNAGQGIDKTIPITQIMDSTKETHAYLSSNADLITNTVTSAVKGFVEGGKDNVTNGVCSLVTTAVTVLFGSTEAQEMTMEKYYVAVEGVSLIRLDIMGWKRAIKAQSLKTKVEQVSAFVMTKSTIDMGKVEFNTFLDLYQRVVLADNPDAKTLDIINDARTLFDAFHKKQLMLN